MKGNTGAARLSRARKESEGMRLHRELQIAEEEERMSRPWDFSPKENTSLSIEPPANHLEHMMVQETVASTSMVKKVPPHRIFLASSEEGDLGLWEHQTNRVHLEKEVCLFDIGTALHEQALQPEVQAFELETMAIGLGHTREWLTTRLDSREVELDSRELQLEGYNSISNKTANTQPSEKDSRILEIEKKEQELVQKELSLHVRQWELEQQERELDSVEKAKKVRKAKKDPKFIRFSDLPVEIRQMIWSFAVTTCTSMKEPHDFDRIHSIRAVPYSMFRSKPSYQTSVRNSEDPEHMQITPGWPSEEKIAYDRVAYVSQHGVPPILHTCKEARNYMLKSYNLTSAFGTLVNFDTDIIFLDWSQCFDEYVDSENTGNAAAKYLTTIPEITKQIKHLAISASPLTTRGFQTRAKMLKDSLGKLETLSFVVDDSRNQYWEEGDRALDQQKYLDFKDYSNDGYWKLQIYNQMVAEGEYETYEKLWMDCMQPDTTSPVIFYATPRFTPREFFGLQKKPYDAILLAMQNFQHVY